MKKQLFVLMLLTAGAMYGAANIQRREQGNRLTGNTYLFDALNALVKPGVIPELQAESLKPVYDILKKASLRSADYTDFDIVDGYIEDALSLPGVEMPVDVPNLGKVPLSELIRAAQAGNDIFESARIKAMLERVNKLLDQPEFREAFGHEEYFKKMLEAKSSLEANNEQAGVRSLQQANTYLGLNPDKKRNYSPVGSSEEYPIDRIISNIIQGRDPLLNWF